MRNRTWSQAPALGAAEASYVSTACMTVTCHCLDTASSACLSVVPAWPVGHVHLQLKLQGVTILTLYSEASAPLSPL